MQINSDTKFLIVGLGLIGGSYARGLTKKGYKVRAITKERQDAEFALKNGYVEYAATEPEEDLIKNSDVIIFALYPHTFIEWVEKYGHLIKKGTLITDVTGVKGSVTSKIQELLPEGVEFIAAHPMAGKETSGVKNSDDKIFLGANYIVVPTEKNSKEAIENCKRIGEILAFSKISVLSTQKHDEMIAFLSQLSHCIAVCLMTCNNSEHLEAYTGDSFRDLTRIADINEYMWTELFLLNKDMLLKEMSLFIKDFNKLYEYINNDDVEGMYEMMRLSSKRRKKFNKEILL